LASAAEARVRATATPIEHVIVIIGENRTFDHLFATYRPPAGQRVLMGWTPPDGIDVPKWRC